MLHSRKQLRHDGNNVIWLLLKFIQDKAKEAACCVGSIQIVEIIRDYEVSKPHHIVTKWHSGHPPQVFDAFNWTVPNQRLRFQIRSPCEDAVCVVLVEIGIVVPPLLLSWYRRGL